MSDIKKTYRPQREGKSLKMGTVSKQDEIKDKV